MATKEAGLQGVHQNYKRTGQLTSGGGPGDTAIDKGASGSHRDNNWKKGAAQGKLAKADKIGPYNNLRGTSGSLY
jgi:hypothetical protein